MAALPRSFGADVTDCIMRFAVGYPRDRVRNVMSSLKRKEVQGSFVWSTVLWYRWRNVSTGEPFPLVRCDFTSRGEFAWNRFPWQRNGKELRQHMAFACDACEPVELQLQRPRF